ncbi:hypothetical protein ACVJGD_004416 [Bradyrhizobium sp. USDA 10063]
MSRRSLRHLGSAERSPARVVRRLTPSQFARRPSGIRRPTPGNRDISGHFRRPVVRTARVSMPELEIKASLGSGHWRLRLIQLRHEPVANRPTQRIEPRVRKYGRPKSRELRILLDGRVSMERTFCNGQQNANPNERVSCQSPKGDSCGSVGTHPRLAGGRALGVKLSRSSRTGTMCDVPPRGSSFRSGWPWRHRHARRRHCGSVACAGRAPGCLPSARPACLWV